MQSKYPYFIFPVIAQLATEKDPQRRLKLKEKLAVNVSSRAELRRLLGINSNELEGFYPDVMAKHLTTTDTIDTFLDKYGKTGEADTLDKIISGAGQSDYFAVMEREKKEAKKVESHNNESGALTAGLAKIMIKNGNYGKALEIIREINLNNPEKSIYFADQMRFIKKLMLNEAKKNTNS